MYWIGNTARLLTWSSGVQLNVSVLTPVNTGWEFVAVGVKENLFLNQTKHIAFVYVLLSENHSGQKFPNDAQHQDCIRTEAGSALRWGYSWHPVSETLLGQASPVIQRAHLPCRKYMNTSASKSLLLLHRKLCGARYSWEPDPNQTPGNLILGSNI